MRKTLDIIKKYPISTSLAALIWIACLVPVPETPLSNVTMFDKWVHFLMYGVLSLSVWIDYFRSHRHYNRWRLFVVAMVCPTIMGGLIELAQAYLTNGVRNGDWLDFAANTIGVCLGNILGFAIHRWLKHLSKR